MSAWDKIAVVSGVTGSIGAAVTRRLINEGYAVIGLAHSREHLAQWEACFEDAPIQSLETDLTDVPSIKRAFQRLEQEHGYLDALVNCAGGGPFGLMTDLSDDVWMNSITLKLLGYIRTSRSARPLLEKSPHGRIVNIVGLFGKQPNPYFCVGSTINAAVLAMPKAYSQELASTRITVNAVNPIAVDSMLWDATIREIESIADENVTRLFKSSPVVTPDDIAATVSFLLREEAQSINGGTISVDRGLCASL